MDAEDVLSQTDSSEDRPMFIVLDEKPADTVASNDRNTIGRLDVEAFKRRSKYLREVYMNPEKRHLYDWTNLEKKILLLDWYHNPSHYEEWRPVETEDMMNKFFSNMLYNFSQLSMTNVGSTVTFVRLLSEFATIEVTYQCAALVQRFFRSNSTYYDELKIALLWVGSEFKGYMNKSEENEYRYPSFEDYQCIMDGMQYNLHTLTVNEFDGKGVCAECQKSQKESRTMLATPKIVFPEPVTSMEMTTAAWNGEKNYLVAVRMENLVKMYNVTSLVKKTLEICKIWEGARKRFFEKVEAVRYRHRENVCMGCMLTEEDLEPLEGAAEVLEEYMMDTPAEFEGLDEVELDWKTVSVMKNTHQTGLKFFYTALVKSKQVLPTFLASISTRKVCIWSIADLSKVVHEPLKYLEFPEDTHPTDVSATVSVARSLEDLRRGTWLVEPKVYTTDDAGHLRLWTLSKGLECTLRFDTSALLTIDVNKKYPHLIALGGDTGKVMIYNTHLQTMHSKDEESKPSLVTLPSHLPNVVYQYLKWYHPVVRIKWVKDVFIAAQHTNPFFAKDSANVTTLAIWNTYKDVFDKEDAFLSNRYWSQSSESTNVTYHLGSKLMCMYGGHYGCLGGMMACDVTWTEEHGLFGVSTDTTGDLHWYKPGIWTWADSDDAMCLARMKLDRKFHENILEIVQREYSSILRESSTVVQGTGSFRKTRSNFQEYIEQAIEVLGEIDENKQLKNDFKSLPSWIKGTLRLTSDEEKYMRMIRREIWERETTEHENIKSAVERSHTNLED
ncbi:uncharacterized protein TOT_040000284 [Theileria orientalis strain Shintoku]|uniref:Uncharacterized protein n=1 Tax=Theileria orientalis strain Shintoku TaxID=869250 RepID=J4DQ63_THEOR|nr:uncharacterized protein TOT_040000284 [Theileria orientalis strain Shintoku]PVC51363.1 hypothetical protein MACL_00001601 [Theileria orientalis]BAM41904.1 uncharacterized protein TOT_040000284 [Theileria orientalis strain Shintoku]|eukprot:XP_009692205.1 uncharacterized protein TOT_040000284 [Theileria orientalis strain Shintoku]